LRAEGDELWIRSVLYHTELVALGVSHHARRVALTFDPVFGELAGAKGLQAHDLGTQVLDVEIEMHAVLPMLGVSHLLEHDERFTIVCGAYDPILSGGLSTLHARVPERGKPERAECFGIEAIDRESDARYH
jgi:hypothetical protein